MILGLKKDFDSKNFGTIWVSNVLISHENSTISQKTFAYFKYMFTVS